MILYEQVDKKYEVINSKVIMMKNEVDIVLSVANSGCNGCDRCLRFHPAILH